MARPSFSVRFPVELVDALDRIAAHRGQSRSDLVEMVITNLEAEDRDLVLKTTVAGPPTEKRNLRLSPGALTRLKQLAGDLEPADFLRRTIACTVALAPPDFYQHAAPQGNGQGPASARANRGAQARRASVDDDLESAAVPPGAAGLVVLAVLVIGALVALILWLICRQTDPPPSGSGNAHRGQLPNGPTQMPGA